MCRYFISLVGIIFIAACAEYPVSVQHLDWSKHCYDGFKSRVETLAGTTFKNCGFYDIHASGSDYLNGVKCADNAYHSNQAFILGSLDFRADTYVCETHIRAGNGFIYKLFLDFDASGGLDTTGSKAVNYEAKCQHLEFDGKIVRAKQCELIKPDNE